MDIEFELNDITADILATQAIMVAVLNRLHAVSPEIAAAVSAGFEDASSALEANAISLGKSASPQVTLRSIEVVEELREGVFPR